METLHPDKNVHINDSKWSFFQTTFKVCQLSNMRCRGRGMEGEGAGMRIIPLHQSENSRKKIYVYKIKEARHP